MADTSKAATRPTQATYDEWVRLTGYTKHPLAYVLELYDNGLAAVAASSGSIDTYQSPAWRAAWQANAAVWGVGHPLIFPTVNPPGDFPVSFREFNDDGSVSYQPPAPGETPYDRCAEIRESAQRELWILEQNTAGLSDGDVVGSTGLTKAQMRRNIQLEFNATAATHGCAAPFPNVTGPWTPEQPPPPASPPPPPPSAPPPPDVPGGPTCGVLGSPWQPVFMYGRNLCYNYGNGEYRHPDGTAFDPTSPPPPPNGPPSNPPPGGGGGDPGSSGFPANAALIGGALVLAVLALSRD